MKKYIYIIIITFLVLIYFLLIPKIISDTDYLDLSSEQFHNTLRKAKENDLNSLQKLQFYYQLKHRDIKSTCLILCHMLTNLEVIDKEEGDFKLYNNLNCNQKINCTKNALEKLSICMMYPKFVINDLQLLK